MKVMNIKASYQQVIAAIGETQDGKKIYTKDIYGQFLLKLITQNTERNPLAVDSGEVDTQDLALDLRYAIHEFSKALEAVEKFNK